jgi:hypothetical protein
MSRPIPASVLAALAWGTGAMAQAPIGIMLSLSLIALGTYAGSKAYILFVFSADLGGLGRKFFYLLFVAVNAGFYGFILFAHTLSNP